MLYILFRNGLIVNDFFCPAVDDLCAVKRKDISAVFFQLKLLRKRQYAGCRSSAREHYGLSLFLDPHQRFFCFRCDLFFGIGQCSVQIQHYNLISHIFSLFRNFLILYLILFHILSCK